MASQKVARIIQKNERTQVRVSVDEYNGKTFLAIREFYLGRPDDGIGQDWFPTKRGVTLDLELIDELIDGLKDVAAA